MSEDNNLTIRGVEFESVPPSEDQYGTIEKLIEDLKKYDQELKCEGWVRIHKKDSFIEINFAPMSWKRKESDHENDESN